MGAKELPPSRGGGEVELEEIGGEPSELEREAGGDLLELLAPSDALGERSTCTCGGAPGGGLRPERDGR